MVRLAPTILWDAAAEDYVGIHQRYVLTALTTATATLTQTALTANARTARHVAQTSSATDQAASPATMMVTGTYRLNAGAEATTATTPTPTSGATLMESVVTRGWPATGNAAPANSEALQQRNAASGLTNSSEKPTVNAVPKVTVAIGPTRHSNLVVAHQAKTVVRQTLGFLVMEAASLGTAIAQQKTIPAVQDMVSTLRPLNAAWIPISLSIRVRKTRNVAAHYVVHQTTNVSAMRAARKEKRLTGMATESMRNAVAKEKSRLEKTGAVLLAHNAVRMAMVKPISAVSYISQTGLLRMGNA